MFYHGGTEDTEKAGVWASPATQDGLTQRRKDRKGMNRKVKRQNVEKAQTDR